MQEYKGEDFMEEDSSSVLLEGNGDKCISTTILQHGAAAIFYPGVCRKICEVLGAEVCIWCSHLSMKLWYLQ